jgi:hypothetical protein
MFTLLHSAQPTPPADDLPSALSFMAWVGTVAFLLLAWRARLAGLVALGRADVVSSVSPRRCSRHGRDRAARASRGTGSLPHAHVLLASAGLALLGLAGLAGPLVSSSSTGA